MSHANNARFGAPCADLVEPTRFVRETLYDASKTIARTMGRALERIVTQVQVRATIKEVSKLSDHTLKDIGIDRTEIKSLARRAAENPNVDYRALS